MTATIDSHAKFTRLLRAGEEPAARDQLARRLAEAEEQLVLACLPEDAP